MAAAGALARGLRTCLLRQAPSLAAARVAQQFEASPAASTSLRCVEAWQRGRAAAPWNPRGRGFSAQAEVAPHGGELQLTEPCIERLKQLRVEAPGSPLSLRITVEGGGCSGFQYRFDIDTAEPRPDDRVVTAGDATVVVDSVSYDFVKGAKLDYSEELIRASFQVIDNPNTEKSCGCGSSFSVK